MPDFKKQNKGGAGYRELSKDDLEFLGGAESPWKSDYSGASGAGYNSRWSDNDGWQRGQEYGFSNTSDDDAFRNPSTARAHEATEDVHQRLYRLIDGQVDQPAGPMLGGGGPVSDNIEVVNGDDGSANQWGGSGRKGPRFAPKTGPVGNMKGHK